MGLELEFSTYVAERKKKKTKIEVAAKVMSSILCEQLRELDLEWQTQEDARLQHFMESKRELQNNMLSQMVIMQEMTIRVHREIFCQLLTQIHKPFYTTHLLCTTSAVSHRVWSYIPE